MCPNTARKKTLVNRRPKAKQSKPSTNKGDPHVEILHLSRICWSITTCHGLELRRLPSTSKISADSTANLPWASDQRPMKKKSCSIAMPTQYLFDSEGQAVLTQTLLGSPTWRYPSLRRTRAKTSKGSSDHPRYNVQTELHCRS